VIVERFNGLNPLDVPAVLVRNHGPFAWGPSGAKAVETALALEIVADMALKTLALNPATSPMPEHLLNKHFLRKHGSNAYYGQAKPLA
jgi:L-ribulose-5-phosphate 4-epimerase